MLSVHYALKQDVFYTLADIWIVLGPTYCGNMITVDFCVDGVGSFINR